jgi:hypothetical protein
MRSANSSLSGFDVCKISPASQLIQEGFARLAETAR